MKKRCASACALGMVLLFAAGWSAMGSAQATVAPTAVVEELLNTVKDIKKAEPDKNIFLTPEDERRNAELSKKVSKVLDIEGISAYALHDYWGKRSPQERRVFVTTFATLLERVAFTNTGKFLKDLDATVSKEKVVGGKAMVYTSVMHEKEGRIDIDFKLHEAGNGWLVEDVLLDGVSLARNLRTQCLKIIRENSFEELLRRMRDKINGADAADDIEKITERRSG